MRFCQAFLSKGIVAVVLASAAAMPACAMPVDDDCAGVNCELNASNPEPVSSSEEALMVEPRLELSGLRLKLPNNPAVYLIDPEGYRRWIPNAYTYEKLFKDYNGIQDYLDLLYIAEGPPLSNGAELQKTADSPAVYLVSNGQKRWITSLEVFNRYYFDEGKITTQSPATLEAISTGWNWYR